MPFSGSAYDMLLFSTLYLKKIHKTTQISKKLFKQIIFHINTNSESFLFYWSFLLIELIKTKTGNIITWVTCQVG